MVRNRIQSVLNLAIIFPDSLANVVHQPLEFAAAVFEVFELIEAGAGRSKQHGVAGLRARVGLGEQRLQAFRSATMDTAPCS